MKNGQIRAAGSICILLLVASQLNRIQIRNYYATLSVSMLSCSVRPEIEYNVRRLVGRSVGDGGDRATKPDAACRLNHILNTKLRHA